MNICRSELESHRSRGYECCVILLAVSIQPGPLVPYLNQIEKHEENENLLSHPVSQAPQSYRGCLSSQSIA